MTDDLIERLKADEPDYPRLAARAEMLFDALEMFVLGEDSLLAERAIFTLGFVSDPALIGQPRILELLKHGAASSDVDTRVATALSLGRLASSSIRSIRWGSDSALSGISALIDNLADDPDARVQTSAKQALTTSSAVVTRGPARIHTAGVSDSNGLDEEIQKLKLALKEAQSAVDETSLWTHQRAVRLRELAVLQREKYLLRGDRDYLFDAIHTLEESLRQFHPSDRERAPYLNDLGNAFADRYSLDGAKEDLDQAVANFRTAAEVVGPGETEYPLYYNDFALALHERFTQSTEFPDTGYLVDLDAAIELLNRVVDRTRPDIPDIALYCYNLAVALEQRHALTGDMGSLKEASHLFQEGLRSTLVGHRLGDSPEVGPLKRRDWGRRVSDRRSWPQVARLRQYRGVRTSPVQDSGLAMDWERGVVVVLPTVPAIDAAHRRMIANEDMLALEACRDALQAWGCPPSQLSVELAEEMQTPVQSNLVTICSPKRSAVTAEILAHKRTRELFSCTFSRLDEPQDDVIPRWAFTLDGDLFESPSYVQESRLIATGKDPWAGPLDDNALLAKFPNPWDASLEVIVVAGCRAFGSWGAAEFLSTLSSRLEDGIYGDHFAVVVPTRTENFEVEVKKPTVIRSLGRKADQ